MNQHHPNRLDATRKAGRFWEYLRRAFAGVLFSNPRNPHKPSKLTKLTMTNFQKSDSIAEKPEVVQTESKSNRWNWKTATIAVATACAVTIAGLFAINPQILRAAEPPRQSQPSQLPEASPKATGFIGSLKVLVWLPTPSSSKTRSMAKLPASISIPIPPPTPTPKSPSAHTLKLPEYDPKPAFTADSHGKTETQSTSKIGKKATIPAGGWSISSFSTTKKTRMVVFYTAAQATPVRIDGNSTLTIRALPKQIPIIQMTPTILGAERVSG